MKGTNTLTLNAASMLEIVQLWLDESGLADPETKATAISEEHGTYAITLETPDSLPK